MPLKDIKAQDKVVEFIKRSLASDKLSHAYLFLGASGVGKHKAAKEFAKFLNCTSRTDDSCGKCPSCIMIDKKAHPDVFFIEKETGKKNISIDAIRVLQVKLSLKPFQGRFNVAVIDAEDLAEEASNSLLKTLEEPSSGTIFILIASIQKALLDTMVSRCQIMRFRPLSQAEVAHILINDFNIDEKEAVFLSSLSGRNVTKALFLNDESVISWKNRIIDNFSNCGSSDPDQDIISGNGLLSNEQACDTLTGFYRDVLVYMYTSKNDLLINADRLEDIAAISKKEDSLKIQQKMGYIEEAKDAFRANANAKLTFSLLKERLIA